MTDTRKTKAELLHELDSLDTKYMELCDEVERLRQLQSHCDGAEELKLIYDKLIEAGFTESQAWEMFNSLIIGGQLPRVFDNYGYNLRSRNGRVNYRPYK